MAAAAAAAAVRRRRRRGCNLPTARRQGASPAPRGARDDEPLSRVRRRDRPGGETQSMNSESINLKFVNSLLWMHTYRQARRPGASAFGPCLRSAGQAARRHAARCAVDTGGFAALGPGPSPGPGPGPCNIGASAAVCDRETARGGTGSAATRGALRSRNGWLRTPGPGPSPEPGPIAPRRLGRGMRQGDSARRHRRAGLPARKLSW